MHTSTQEWNNGSNKSANNSTWKDPLACQSRWLLCQFWKCPHLGQQRIDICSKYIWEEGSVNSEAGAVSHKNWNFLNRLPNCHKIKNYLLWSFLGTHNFHERHHMSRTVHKKAMLQSVYKRHHKLFWLKEDCYWSKLTQ